jgi:hypothetical protein
VRTTLPVCAFDIPSFHAPRRTTKNDGAANLFGEPPGPARRSFGSLRIASFEHRETGESTRSSHTRLPRSARQEAPQRSESAEIGNRYVLLRPTRAMCVRS